MSNYHFSATHNQTNMPSGSGCMAQVT